MDGWMDGWMGGWMDGWMDGRIDSTCTCLHMFCIIRTMARLIIKGSVQ